jgi:hypothetical protein
MQRIHRAQAGLSFLATARGNRMAYVRNVVYDLPTMLPPSK